MKQLDYLDDDLYNKLPTEFKDKRNLHTQISRTLERNKKQLQKLNLKKKQLQSENKKLKSKQTELKNELSIFNNSYTVICHITYDKRNDKYQLTSKHLNQKFTIYLGSYLEIFESLKHKVDNLKESNMKVTLKPYFQNELNKHIDYSNPKSLINLGLNRKDLGINKVI